jgi:hypothetical protein
MGGYSIVFFLLSCIQFKSKTNFNDDDKSLDYKPVIKKNTFYKSCSELLINITMEMLLYHS